MALKKSEPYSSLTSGLARMNMILHNNSTALILQGNTLADPKFKDGDTLKTFDYIVANPLTVQTLELFFIAKEDLTAQTSMDQFMPKWQFCRAELNRLLVRHDDWAY